MRRYCFDKKLHSQNVIKEKLCKMISYEEVRSKMLMKLTPVDVPTTHLPEVGFIPTNPGWLVNLVESSPEGQGHEQTEDNPFAV